MVLKSDTQAQIYPSTNIRWAASQQVAEKSSFRNNSGRIVICFSWRYILQHPGTDLTLQHSVQNFGVGALQKINAGSYFGSLSVGNTRLCWSFNHLTQIVSFEANKLFRIFRKNPEDLQGSRLLRAKRWGEFHIHMDYVASDQGRRLRSKINNQETLYWAVCSQWQRLRLKELCHQVFFKTPTALINVSCIQRLCQ